jgi:hypothetical protein
MARALFPIHCYATPAAAEVIGPHITTVTVKAPREAFREGRGLEIAHQQIVWGDRDLAFSTRVTDAGDIAIEFDIGDPALRKRLVLEEDLRREGRRLRGVREERRRR